MCYNKTKTIKKFIFNNSIYMKHISGYIPRMPILSQNLWTKNMWAQSEKIPDKNNQVTMLKYQVDTHKLIFVNSVNVNCMCSSKKINSLLDIHGILHGEKISISESCIVEFPNENKLSDIMYLDYSLNYITYPNNPTNPNNSTNKINFRIELNHRESNNHLNNRFWGFFPQNIQSNLLFLDRILRNDKNSAIIVN